MKIIKYDNWSQKFWFKYALVIVDNYIDLDDKWEVTTVCTLLDNYWYRKIFINKWWYIPVAAISFSKKYKGFKYGHGWYDIQIWYVELGFINISWEGSPMIDKSRKRKS